MNNNTLISQIQIKDKNSSKKFENQVHVWNNILEQKKNGNKNIIGMMLESNLFEGSQKLTDPKDLKYGVSITDECLGWQDTEDLLLNAAQSLKSLK